MRGDARRGDLGSTADVVVVGGGLSGLECACGLLDAGVGHVVVVDRAGIPGAAVTARPAWQSTGGPHYAPPATPAHRLGGRSLQWHGVVLRLEDWALADPRWPADVVADLARAADGSPGLYDEVERDLRRWSGGALDGATPTADRRLAQLASAWGCGPAQAVPQAVRRAQATWTPYSPLGAWRRATAPGAGGRTVEGVQAIEVLVTGGRTTGVRVGDPRSGEHFAVHADTVVLAAGVLENTRLVAQALGDPDGAGAGLNDHLVQGFCVRVPGGGDLPEAFVLIAGDAQSRSNVFVRSRAVEGSDDLLLDVWAMGEQEPSADPRVRFDAEAGLPWSGRVHPELSAADERVVADQQRTLRALWDGAAATLGLPRHPLAFGRFFEAPTPFAAARGAALAGPGGCPHPYGWPLGTVEHESGTLALGGPLDASGQVRTVAGLHVVGPATFPRSGAANPSLTTLALARRTARRIAGG